MLRRFLNKITREHLVVFAPGLLVAIIGFWAAYQFVGPPPPSRIVMSSGSEDGAYHMFAQRYQELLARDGISLEVRTSTGSLENIQRLEAQNDGVEIAFVQGGTSEAAGSQDLRSIASLYYEPLWVFSRGAKRLERLPKVRGKRIAIDQEGSGTRHMALVLLEANRVSGPPTTLLSIGGQEAAEALLRGEIDVAFFVTSADSAVIGRLMRDRDVRLMSFERADAYARKYAEPAAVTIPEGIIDLEENIPPSDITLLAVTANLVVRKDFHPALIGLLLGAAKEIHGAGGLFEQPKEFPSAKHVEFPLSQEAQHYFEHGPPPLRRYLPFWAATFVNRTIVLLIPVLVLLWPLFKILPPVYRWRVQAKVYRWYKDVKAIDARLRETCSLEGLRALQTEVDQLEEAVSKVSTPLRYAGQQYDLRMHLNLVRERLAKAMNEVATGGGVKV